MTQRSRSVRRRAALASAAATDRRPVLWASMSALALFSAAMFAASASAQSVIVRSGSAQSEARELQAALTRRSASCTPDDAEFLRLTRVPEGVALLRLRSDLDAASRIGTLRTQSGAAMPVERIVSMQREVDSLARVIDRVMIAAPLRGELVHSEAEARRAVTYRVRELVPRVEQAVELALARIDRAATPVPTLGYFGVTLSSVPFRQVLQSGYIVSYCEYPLVESVDPGSPADRGGMLAGDTIIAFNGQDVLTGMVDYTSLLVPNTTLRVRSRREGRNVDAAVRIVPRPDASPVRMTARATASTSQGASPVASVPFVVQTPLPRTFIFESSQGTLSPTPSAPPASVAPGVPPAWTLFSFTTNSDDAIFAGAQLKSLSADMRSALSLPEGVLVWKVLRGTPAADGGLRDGDVIRSANGRAVVRVNDVRMALESADARVLTLRISRKDAADRNVVLRW